MLGSANINQSGIRVGELALGTEETVLRNNDPKLLSHSPSIIDIGCGGNIHITPAGSFVSLTKENQGITSGSAGNSAPPENANQASAS